jgi:phage terminase Nu1 subunit (DNA packaging protein)
MAAKKTNLVSVDKVAEVFRISERAVQRLVIYEGMPRKSRGEYDLDACLVWYAVHLHQKLCGCAGSCDGFDAMSRNAVNARAERRKALREIADLAPDLVGKTVDAIRKLLTKAVEDSYDQ